MAKQTDTILASMTFPDETVRIVKGNVEEHVFRCPHTIVELVDKDGEIAYAYLYEHTHPMNELEAWHQFGMLCLSAARRNQCSTAGAFFSTED